MKNKWGNGEEKSLTFSTKKRKLRQHQMLKRNEYKINKINKIDERDDI